MPSLDDVPMELRLSYFVGEIVIADSYAEHEARVLWTVLADLGVLRGRRPEAFGRLLPGLIQAFAPPAVPEAFSRIAQDALHHAQRWHRFRRDLVHDLLALDRRGTGDVFSALRRHPPRPMEDLEQCAAALRESAFRMRALYITVPFWMGGNGDGWEDSASLDSWTRVAMGHIAISDHVVSGTAGPSPAPPGGWDTRPHDGSAD